ncbi:hypothetical protein H920_07433 [Fukomys damarensis]|uniref:Uncharacterized protein n=1 Tax=Fukomys damarensis TaxID=885580 RepID=A0A091DG68_FUKDA|nr:hypothetical protein H920_07433 [Fukomys damarensis]
MSKADGEPSTSLLSWSAAATMSFLTLKLGTTDTAPWVRGSTAAADANRSSREHSQPKQQNKKAREERIHIRKGRGVKGEFRYANWKPPHSQVWNNGKEQASGGRTVKNLILGQESKDGELLEFIVSASGIFGNPSSTQCTAAEVGSKDTNDPDKENCRVIALTDWKGVPEKGVCWVSVTCIHDKRLRVLDYNLSREASSSNINLGGGEKLRGALELRWRRREGLECGGILKNGLHLSSSVRFSFCQVYTDTTVTVKPVFLQKKGKDKKETSRDANMFS